MGGRGPPVAPPAPSVPRNTMPSIGRFYGPIFNPIPNLNDLYRCNASLMALFFLRYEDASKNNVTPLGKKLASSYYKCCNRAIIGF